MYYLSSKAALNAAMQGVALALRQKKVGVLLLHPGKVMTRIGSKKGILMRESVAGMRQVVEAFSMDKGGSFAQYDGQEILW